MIVVIGEVRVVWTLRLLVQALFFRRVNVVEISWAYVATFISACFIRV